MTSYQIAIDVGLIGMIFFMGYCILQVVEVIREEREMMVWRHYDREHASALRDEDDYSEPAPENGPNPLQDPKL
jgi:hypothetical protein